MRRSAPQHTRRNARPLMRRSAPLSTKMNAQLLMNRSAPRHTSRSAQLLMKRSVLPSMIVNVLHLTSRNVLHRMNESARLPTRRNVLVTRGRGVSKTSVIPLSPTLGTVSLITILMFVAFVLSTIRGECSISHFISCSLKFTLSSYSSLLEFLCTTNCFPAWRYLFQFWT